MKKYLILMAGFFAASASVQAAQSIDEAALLLSKTGGVPVRLFSTRDFGREKYTPARSILVPKNNAPDVLKIVRKTLSPGFIAFVGTTNNLEKKNVKVVEVVVAKGKSQFDIL